MLFNFLRGSGGELVDRIESKVQTMLAYDRHEFDLAMSALFGNAVAGEVNGELRATDRKVNQLEREIRRELVVHASVVGSVHTPAILVYMSIVKDIERVGDYAKNLLDLAIDGANFAQISNADEWRDLSREISSFIGEAGTAFQRRDVARSRALLGQGDKLLHFFDERVTLLVQGNWMDDQPVPRALAHRYLKRIVAHLMNLLSAVVMPLDQVDYFDEDPEDRGR
jgi:phosphate uptake regulator